jgi:phenylacetate-CoA ligase
MSKKLIGRFLRRLVPRSDYRREYSRISAFDVEDALRSLLLHAHGNVPHYRSVLGEVGVVHSGTVDLSLFERIPVLTKDTIRANQASMISADSQNRGTYRNASGGSTGQPIELIQDAAYRRWGDAASHYWYWDILGIDEPSVRKVVLWGSERDLFQGGIGWKVRAMNWLSNTTFLNSLKMTEADMATYIRTFNSCRPELVRGYANSLYELCRYAERTGTKVHSPKAVVSSAEMLTDKMRSQIQRVLGARVYDFYGSRECNNVAGECKEGLMHVFMFHNYLEVLDGDGRPVKEGQEGRVVLTNLHNYSMPLIRYEIGDLAVRGPDRASCGHPLPTLSRITGRTIDAFVKRNGEIVPGEALALTIYEEPWIKQFQLVQEDYAKVRILVVLQDRFDENRKADIERQIRFLLGAECTVLWDFVEEVPTTPQGKYRYIRSLIAR